MVSGHSDSFRLFRFRGIQVYLHWFWFLWAFFQIYQRQGSYSSIGWNIAEYLALFLIVLLHEFGHSFACRQTGGKADKIVLWPLGGVAFVQPPPRAGAELWSIAAGPLVNVVLYPLLMVAVEVSASMGYAPRNSDFGKLLYMIWWINSSLLVFNLLPIYPLDGGQILRSLLWFKLGRARSLQVATAIGLVGIPLLAVYALAQSRSNFIFILFMAYFLWQACWSSWKHAATLLKVAALPRHRGFECPSCREAPPSGAAWICPACGNRFDPFVTDGLCPHCRSARDVIPCPQCGAESGLTRWRQGPRPGNGTVIDV